MTKEYKLCPKCNNALNNKIMQCPYCGERLWINFLLENTSWHNTISKSSPNLTKKSSWCLTFFIIFFIIQIIWNIITFIVWIIPPQSNQDTETSNTKESFTITSNNTRTTAIKEFDEIYKNIKNLNYPKYKDKEGWDVKIATSSIKGTNEQKTNIVILKYKWSELKKYFLQLDELKLTFFYDDEKNQINEVTEDDVINYILPIFRKYLTEFKSQKDELIPK